jgi:biotin carboxylase
VTATETVLVLTGYDLETIPVVHWLADRFRVVLIASRNAANERHPGAFAEAIGRAADWRWIDDVFDSRRTVETALEWHRGFGVDHVVCLDEKGLVCAAELRRLLGVKTGQDVESAHAYRFKDRMYRAAARGVAVPEFVVAASTFEVARAVERLGMPVVVKPVGGSGSRDTHVLGTEEELGHWLAARPLGLSSPMLVQRFVDGTMFHVDGLAVAGGVHAVRVSRYGGSTLGYQGSQPLTSTMLEPDSELSALLVDQVARTVAALPDAGDGVFHAEFFVTATGEVYLCEIAARAGGGGIRQCHELATGVNLFHAHTLLQCGLREEVLAMSDETVVDRGRYGFFLESAPTGRLLSASVDCGLPGVVSCDVMAKLGQVHSGASSSADVLRRFVVEVGDEAETAELYRRIDAWCRDSLVVAGPVAS